LKIKVRPYKNDPTRHHVDVRIEDPTADPKSLIRRRLVAPSGMDPLAAKVWGEEQAKLLLRELVRRVRGEEESARPTPKPTIDDAPRKDRILTMSEFWDRFFPRYVARQKKGTQDSYTTIWQRHLRPLLGDTPLDLIDRAAIARVCDAAEDKQLDPATIRQIQAKLHKALRWAMSKGLTPEAVLPKLETEKAKKKVKALYSREDLKRLLAAARSVEDEALVMLAWHGALRIGEIPALKWADIDWSAKIMMISRNVYKSRVQDNPKGEVGPVPMSAKLIAVLQRMRRDDGSPWVFPPGRKTDLAWWTDPSARKRMKALQLAAGLPVLGPHRVRHSVLTHLANRNVSPYSLQAFARHANMRTTLDYYVHLQKAELAAAAVDVLDEEDARDEGAPSRRGNARRTRGKARGNTVAIAGNTPEFVDWLTN
jgi:integrase